LSQPRFVSFSRRGRIGYGLLADQGVVDCSVRVGARWPGLREVVAADALARLADEAARHPADFGVDDVDFEIPVRDPEKIICVGVNFPDRNEEYKDGQAAQSNPSLFVRFPRSFSGHNHPLIRPPESAQLDYEGEIVLIIGKGGRRIPETQAFDHVAALSLCNEGTLRDWVRHAKFNVTQGKNFDASGSIGPYFVSADEIDPAKPLHLTTKVNGEVRQDDTTANLIFGFADLLAYITIFTTLKPGDIIVTGTPVGAGARFDPPRWLKPGDVVEVAVPDIGTLRNQVADEP
jgi:2-keto-4-pentenoate hydratase/2-oxohepta-3-ene-1,7-dioic acid hydratase in catechol pathway